MNMLLSTGGYKWTIIQVKNRTQYLQSLEKIHTEQTIEPFTKLILQEMKELF